VNHRVFITGIGAVTPIGIGRDRLWRQALEGSRAVRALDRFDPAPFRSKVAGQVDDFDPSAFLERRALQRSERFAQFSIAAARMAFEDAGYMPNGDGADFGVWVGSALGGAAYGETQNRNFIQRGVKGIHPMLALSVFPAAACCNIAIHFGIHGPTISNSNSCAAGATALGEAFRAVRSGFARRALAGGIEIPLTPLIFGAFDVIKSMSQRNDDPQSASRPFDAGRDGFVMAEAACLLLLEREEDVVARDATPYAEIAGFALTNDGQHMAAPREDGREAKRAMVLAMQDAGVGPADVDHVNAHGSSTPLNDPTESRAIRDVFGGDADRVIVSGIKGMIGHALGATGAVEAALCAIGLKENVIVPTVNLEAPAEGCDLRYSPGVPTPFKQRAVLSNSFGFGGLNAALVLKAA
jgi:3-oxoacyl-[acyl-carrier-protein] synthase II